MRPFNTVNRKKRSILPLLSALLAVLTALPSISEAQTKPGPPPAENAAFSQVWQRADMPVAQGRAQRSWLWGPKSLATMNEALVESPGGFRQVQYYDKARMEVNNPGSDPNKAGYVTNGLLVTEMMSGRLQVGVNAFEQRAPAAIPVAGDRQTAAGQPANTLTYAALARVASLQPGQNADSARIGGTVNIVLSPQGDPLRVAPPFADNLLPKINYFEPTARHNIPDVFYDFMTQKGMVFENGQYRQGVVLDWLSALGYPITEPYWTNIQINGKAYPIMVQAFQRRLLTYNPANAPAWRVEMGNVGAQYYQWRYNAAPAPQPGGGTTLNIRRGEFPDTLKTGSYSGIEQTLYQAIADQTTWDDVWARHTARYDAYLPTPRVDFKNEFVVVAFWGNKPNGCYSLKIDSVSLKQGGVQVVVNQEQKGGGCTQAITQPNDIVFASRAGIPAGKVNVSFIDTEGKEISSGALMLP